MYDPSVPVLTDIVAAGDPARARRAPPMSLSLGEEPAVAGAKGPAAFADAGISEHDADAVVERLRGRCLTWLAGDGRTMVEARCRAALQEHSNWLVGQITREVGLALETELAGWVREALRDAAASRSGGA
jgi:hypothetical protein